MFGSSSEKYKLLFLITQTLQVLEERRVVKDYIHIITYSSKELTLNLIIFLYYNLNYRFSHHISELS